MTRTGRVATGASPTAVEIIDYEARYRDEFRRLNEEWLRRYFRIEAVDQRVLSDPQQSILAPGGAIVFARQHHQVLGTCALMHHGEGVYELTKMGVTNCAQGQGIGAQLMVAILARYRRIGGRELFLETSSKLAPAIALYQRFGFVDQGHRRPGSGYQRSDVYMIWSDPQS